MKNVNWLKLGLMAGGIALSIAGTFIGNKVDDIRFAENFDAELEKRGIATNKIEQIEES